jgi:hypothetical protein
VIPDTITLELPVFLTVTSCALVLPTSSLPKSKLELDSERVRVAVTPVPLNGMASVGLLKLLLTTILPVLLPVVVGAKVTVRFMVTPGASHSGVYKLLILNPVPLNDALERVSIEPLVFFS